ncbi:Lrp/AsnC family transcriptional regulator [Aquitalea sp. LB_tupeE]|uniref:siroheme decarboxylase subunit beta n=1 Tax=Aquitalea sp. LB_tupeE TaxID=2748078 RepID=UPI0015BA4C18|nr:Lrp/AsnC family transcriptional regulator [Aquitalea sp. LB_tupeE]NWK78808.1 Lrp/AsnC family transcriptional regulator [Aquitalea sp. LB_tupeE]
MTINTSILDNKLALHLLNDLQHSFPIEPRPFYTISRNFPGSFFEGDIIELLSDSLGCGVLSRIGAIFPPKSVGSSTLAAMSVPSEKLSHVVAVVNSYREVNHNYLRDHFYNLWFVVAANTKQMVLNVLDDIECKTGIKPLNLPMVKEYHIDLAFKFMGEGKLCTIPSIPDCEIFYEPSVSSICREMLIAAIASGIPLVSRPFYEIGLRCGLSEFDVINQIKYWMHVGVVKRFGAVVRHHELGFRSNAMCVWKIDDVNERERIALKLSDEPSVTLCYERPPILPDWPYQLFTMIHAKSEIELRTIVADIVARNCISHIPHEILRSTQRFKQVGAQYGLQ